MTSTSTETERIFGEMVSAARSLDYRHAHAIGRGLMDRAPEVSDIRFQHARNCIAVGEWEQALRLFDSVRDSRSFGGPPIPTSVPLWCREPLAGRTLLLVCEGGLGDAICFSRFAAPLRNLGATVVLAGYEPIFELQRTIPGVHSLVDREVAHRTCFDFWLPALSAPRLLGLRLDQIGGDPYVRCPPRTSEKWKRIFGARGRTRVGLSWQGNPGFSEDHLRSIPGELFRPILELEELQFFKAQVNSENNSVTHPNLIDLTSEIRDPVDLAGFLEQLDVFVSVDSGMAHLSAAMGIPTLLLNRVMGWFVFSVSPDHSRAQETPWYRSMRILHQSAWGDWTETLQRLRELLRRREFPARA